MTPAQRLLLIIGGSLILIVLAIFIVYPAFAPSAPVTETQTPAIVEPSTINPLPVNDTTPAESTPVAETPKEISDGAQRAEVERLSRLFVERFGSYSNFSNFENITSLEAFMTEDMLAYAKTLMKTPAEQTIGSYNGITTSVISLNTTSFTAKSKAVVTFVVQQETQSSLDAPIVSEYRDGRVELVFSGGQWLVDGLFYNKK